MASIVLMPIVHPQVCEGLPAGDYAIKQAGPEDVEVTHPSLQPSPLRFAVPELMPTLCSMRMCAETYREVFETVAEGVTTEDYNEGIGIMLCRWRACLGWLI